MLLGEQGSGDQNRHLLARPSSQERRAHGNLGFPETDIATHQAIHGLLAGHVLEHRLDSNLLVWCLLERKAGSKGTIGFLGILEAEAFARLPAGVHIQQLGGSVPDLLKGFLFRCAPAVRPEFVQRRVFGVIAGIAGNQVQAGDRNIQL